MCGTCGCSGTITQTLNTISANAVTGSTASTFTGFAPVSNGHDNALVHAQIHHPSIDLKVVNKAAPNKTAPNKTKPNTTTPEQTDVQGTINIVKLEQQILAHNDHLAQHNREDYLAQNIVALNLVSSPGSGKTTLLEKTLASLLPETPCAVIEGDQQTDNDATRIAATGAAVVQINTGTGCHLEADMVRKAGNTLALQPNSILFIENVGNLVCPALFDLGERDKVAILSVTEGADKPLKYPHMFRASSLMIINKTDLLPYVDFDVEQCIAFAKQVNPTIEVIQLSATKGQGMNDWLDWLQARAKQDNHVHAV